MFSMIPQLKTPRLSAVRKVSLDTLQLLSTLNLGRQMPLALADSARQIPAGFEGNYFKGSSDNSNALRFARAVH